MMIADAPRQPYDKIQIDLVGPLLTSLKGNVYILTI